MLDQAQLARTMFPVGDLQKSQVRELASRINLRTADKPDSQDVCFIMSTKGGRTTFLGDRIPFHRAAVVDTSGARLGEVEAIELVTIGQRKGIGLPGGGPKRYVVDVDTAARVVTVGDEVDMLRPTATVHSMTWVDEPVLAGDVLVQCSAHGEPKAATIAPPTEPGRSSWCGTTRNAASPPARASCSTTSPTPESSAAASPAETVSADGEAAAGGGGERAAGAARARRGSRSGGSLGRSAPSA